jgi:hypothetical protein
MKRAIILFVLIFLTAAPINAQLITNVNGEIPFENSYKEPASKQLKTARFFIISGYTLTGLGGLLWLSESALYQGEGKAPTAPYIVMTTVGIGSLILGYSLKSKALRNNDASIYFTPQQTDINIVKKGTPPFIPAIKLKIGL